MDTPFLSVCSGVGVPELGWAEAGLHSVLVSEIEAFPRAVLMHRFGAEDARRSRKGGVPMLWGDFAALRVRHLRRLGVVLPRVLVGGTPCQSFSIAGKRGSLSDARGNLALSFVRLAHALANAQAGAARTADDATPVFYAVWENVPGVLSTDDNAFGCFLGALVGGDRAFDLPSHLGRWPDAGMVAGPGARAAWRVLDAQHFGVPQRRARVFVVVGFGAGADPAEILLEPESVSWDLATSAGAEEDVAGTLAGGARGRGGYSHDDIPLTAKPVLAGGHATNPLDETLLVEAFGGANGSRSLDLATAVNAHPGGRYDYESETFIAHMLRGEGFDASEDGTGRGTPLVVTPFDTTQITSPANRSNPQPGDPCHPLAAGAHPPAIAFNARQDAEVYGDMAGTLDGSSPQAQAIAWSIMPQNSGRDYKAREVDVLQPLMAGGPVGGNQGGDFIQQQQGVRRLTPRECERLQDVPDDHTLIPWRGKPAEECPDGPRYKACGNAMNRAVMVWIGLRLARQLQTADAVMNSGAAPGQPASKREEAE